MMSEFPCRGRKIRNGWAVLVLVWAFSTNAAAQMPEPALVKDCQPCKFKIHSSLPEYSFRFVLQPRPHQLRVVSGIQCIRGAESSAAQVLDVKNMDPLGLKEDFFFGGQDINFDGYLDVVLATRRGMPNTYADYWLFVPGQGMFRYLGNYPVFTVNPKDHRLSTYERGGHGGMIYEAKDYCFVRGKLALMRSEKQETTEKAGVYRKTIRRRIKGALRVVQSELVTAKPTSR